MEKTELIFEKGDLSPRELNDLIDEFFDAAGDDEAVRFSAEEAGVDLEALLAGGPDQIRFKGRKPRFTGVELLLIGMFAGPPVQSAWNEVVLPWLRSRFRKPVGTPKQKSDLADEGEEGDG